MSALELNDALQRATSEGEWVYWGMGDSAFLANSRAHVELGRLSEGLDALMAKLPEAERRLRAIR